MLEPLIKKITESDSCQGRVKNGGGGARDNAWHEGNTLPMGQTLNDRWVNCIIRSFERARHEISRVHLRYTMVHLREPEETENEGEPTFAAQRWLRRPHGDPLLRPEGPGRQKHLAQGSRAPEVLAAQFGRCTDEEMALRKPCNAFRGSELLTNKHKGAVKPRRGAGD